MSDPFGDEEPPRDVTSREETPPTPDVTVRPADRADLLDVLRIERQSFAEPWPYAAFETVLDAPAFLVAVGEGVDGPSTVLGYVVGDVMPNHGRDIGHIKDLAVRPEARGQGIGRRLLREGLFGLALAGAAVVKLEVRESNEPARSLYREEGFERTRRMPRYYADGEDALLLAVDVESWRASE